MTDLRAFAERRFPGALGYLESVRFLTSTSQPLIRNVGLQMPVLLNYGETSAENKSRLYLLAGFANLLRAEPYMHA